MHHSHFVPGRRYFVNRRVLAASAGPPLARKSAGNVDARAGERVRRPSGYVAARLWPDVQVCGCCDAPSPLNIA